MPVTEIPHDEYLTMKCPFCEGTFAAGYTDGDPTVLHMLPPCESCVKLNPNEFLGAVRSRLQTAEKKQ